MNIPDQHKKNCRDSRLVRVPFRCATAPSNVRRLKFPEKIFQGFVQFVSFRGGSESFLGADRNDEALGKGPRGGLQVRASGGISSSKTVIRPRGTSYQGPRGDLNSGPPEDVPQMFKDALSNSSHYMTNRHTAYSVTTIHVDIQPSRNLSEALSSGKLKHCVFCDYASS